MEDMSAMNYEILIRRAFNCGRYGRKGADADIFRSLVMQENFDSNILPNANQKLKYLKMFKNVKIFVIDALKQGIKRLRKMKAEQSDINILIDHISHIEKIEDRKELAVAIEKSLNSFIKLKIDMTYI